MTTDQMIEVDRLMIEVYNIELIQMMENAGRCLAMVAVEEFLKTALENKKVVVLAGNGGNGGGALVCARRLHSLGCNIYVYLANADKMTPVPNHQLSILKNMGVPIVDPEYLDKVSSADLIIDGLVGYSINGDPRGKVKDMIDWANEQEAPVLALDTPSGLDLTTGTVHNPTIKAAATLTLALPKHGLFEKKAVPKVGNLFLGNISVPPALYGTSTIGLLVSSQLFVESDVVRLS
ncbi:NAD(P)H-hydrate epimerase [Neolewinella persica]|uniref:NAD(P)H-hydrate epimerase n=1 Tax=Neolewinella persica TaxID=70998 RepID=UPI0003A9F09F|nr:NAD(P)H-hydrate epimerase [Neolewinella persica]